MAALLTAKQARIDWSADRAVGWICDRPASGDVVFSLNDGRTFIGYAVWSLLDDGRVCRQQSGWENLGSFSKTYYEGG